MAFPAKYPGTCPICLRAFPAGEPIAKSGSSYAHVDCAAQEQGALDLAIRTGPQPVPVPDADDGPLRVWTDGACSGNPGPGGWAWATRDGREGSGGAKHTTNQRMEIQAALEAVTTLTERPLTVVSDSTYVVNCFRNSWWRGWLAKGWVNSQKKPVANRELWEPLIAEYQRGGIDFEWVKGHSGDVMNDRVDALAVVERDNQAR